MNRLPDHARGLSQVPPTAPVADVVQRLKGGTSYLLRNECPALEANLWGRGCGATGAVAETSGAQRYAAVKRDMREHADRLPHQVRSRGL
ncbi:MAG: transposase [Candidatus Omnitrophica bacterium]|nr:transposase [Candidatus Omnitrophota bacterium]